MEITASARICFTVLTLLCIGGCGLQSQVPEHQVSQAVLRHPGNSLRARDSAARRAAALILRSISVPPSAAVSSVEPLGGGSVLAHADSAQDTPNVVDEHHWWVVPASRSAVVLSYIETHRPPGTTTVFVGSGTADRDGVRFRDVGFAWPSLPDVFLTRWLTVAVVQLPNRTTAVRADAQVVWVAPRPVGERVPADSSSVRIEITRQLRTAEAPVAVTSPGTVASIVSLINKLPIAQPGVSYCGNDLGVRVRLAFYRSPEVPPAAVATVNPGGCGDVQLTIAGHREPTLAGDLPALQRTSAMNQLAALLGRRLVLPPAP